MLAFSSYTILPSIEVIDVTGPGCVTVSFGVCVVGSETCCGTLSTISPTGFALPISTASSFFLNSLYSAIEELHELHMYCPFSARIRFSATSSLGFSNSIFGGPSNSFSQVLQKYLVIVAASNLPIGAKNRSGPPRFPFTCCSSVTLAIT